MTASRMMTSALLALFTAGAAQALSYQATPFQVPGATDSYLYDINNAGAILGNATISGSSQIFIAQGGVFSFIASPSGALSSFGLGMSETGTVVGGFADTLVDDGGGNLVPGFQKGFIYEGGSHTTLQIGGYDETVARAISPNGRYVTGYVYNSEGGYAGWLLDRSSGVNTVITTGQLVIAQGVDDSGRVIGSRAWAETEGGPLLRQSFWYQDGSLSYFQLAGQSDTRARDFNTGGLMAGWVRNGSQVSAFVGSVGDYALLDHGDSGFTVAEGLNDAGIAVGSWVDANGVNHALVFTPVSEPATLLLFAGGLGFVAWRRKLA